MSENTLPKPPPLPARKDAVSTNGGSELGSPLQVLQPPALPARTKRVPSPITVPPLNGNTPPPQPVITPRLAVTPASPQSAIPENAQAGPSRLPSLSDTSANAGAPPMLRVRTPPLPPLISKSNQDGGQTINIPQSDVMVVGLLLLNLLYLRLSWRWILLLGVIYAFLRLRALQPESGLEDNVADKDRTGREASKDAVEWVNHALYALFPLISTDVLTPFVDLMEDALIEQCPMIITSVRITSPSLGAQPLLLTSLKALSDKDWFDSLAPQKKSSDDTNEQSRTPESRKRAGTTDQAPPPTTFTPTRHGKSGSDGLSPPKEDEVSSRPGLRSRSSSASSVGSTMNASDIERDGQRRRKRDRILQKISRRHKDQEKAASNDSARQDSNIPGKSSADLVDTNEIEEDLNAGRYLNYQIGFEYHRPKVTQRKGWGLHALAYMGWGIKGVGTSEIPIYIDVMEIKGTLNIRLLLSPRPPFVRTATISLPEQPTVDLTATPLRKGGFDALRLPGMKSYVQASIAEVVKAFVRPNSYSLTVDRLLLGRDSALSTRAVGVLKIVIHRAFGLMKVDAMGSCDPYVVISFSKFNKPLFSTRTIVDNPNPQWEETTYLLVSSDAVEAGEKLRLRILDSDRFSADDALGRIEEELADLVNQSYEKGVHDKETSDKGLTRKTSLIRADRLGMKATGTLEWSVQFCPLWQMPAEEMEKRMKKVRHNRKGEPSSGSSGSPWWMDWLANLVIGPEWEVQRAERRKETLAWLTGEKEREEMEAAARPSDKLRSGVLQFHIHQCSDLEFESTQGTFKSPSNRDRDISAAGGRPALAELIDRTPAENPEPPSAYCEVHLNDRLVYRTRTKQVTPLPYFNAVSERFIRDWRLAKVVFVVRDDRDLEHDPILGLVSLRLGDIFSDSSQITRWFPLRGGLGWGRIRLSLLFKPIDVQLPLGISGYEVATLSIKSLSATELQSNSPHDLSVLIETESDRFEVSTPDSVDVEDSADVSLHEHEVPESGPSTPAKQLNGHPNIQSAPTSARSARFSLKSANSYNSRQSMTFDLDSAAEVEWDLVDPIRLAVEYRHSSSVVFRFHTKSTVRRKRRIQGIACVRLDEAKDDVEFSHTAPIFGTDDLRDAVKGAYEYEHLSHEANQDVEGRSTMSVQTGDSIKDVKIIGFVNLVIVVRPGISRIHRKLCKRDLRFQKVYEAWEITKEMDRGWDKLDERDQMRSVKEDAKAAVRRGARVSTDNELENEEDEDDDGHSGSDENDDGVGEQEPIGGPRRRSSFYDQTEGFMSEKKAHSRALHKRNKGIFQLKVARTGKFVFDKIQAKAYARRNEKKVRGTDPFVEHEGQSHL